VSPAITAIPTTGTTRVQPLLVLVPAVVAAVNAFSLMAINEPSAASQLLNAQSD
jgi:hypothetical protein